MAPVDEIQAVVLAEAVKEELHYKQFLQYTAYDSYDRMRTRSTEA